MIRRVLSLERVVELGLLVFGLAYVVAVLRYPQRAGVVPAMVGAVLVAAVLVQLGQGLKAGRDEARHGPAAPEDTDDDVTFGGMVGEAGMDHDSRRRLATIALWTVALVVVLQVLGFVVGAVVGMAAFMLLARQARVLTAAVSLLLGVGVYLLTDVLLDIAWNSAPLLEALT